jgi:hypothetical protein
MLQRVIEQRSRSARCAGVVINNLPLRKARRREIETAFATLVQRGTDALLVANDPFFTNHHDQIVALAPVTPIDALAKQLAETIKKSERQH